MFDVSWGELAVLMGVGLVLIGRQDLPRAAHMLGIQVGRGVGLLQGARARADRFAANNELRQLQNELKSGLRELDAVKSELAATMSTGGVMGRGQLGATVSSANRQNLRPQPPSTALSPSSASTMSQLSSGAPVTAAQTEMGSLSHTSETLTKSPIQPSHDSQEASPADTQHHQTMIAAVAEEEWKRQGIHFSSRAEQGSGMMGGDVDKTGSATLAGLLRQSLIFDQYDRIVKEQDEALQSKVASVLQRRKEKQQRDDTSQK